MATENKTEVDSLLKEIEQYNKRQKKDENKIKITTGDKVGSWTFIRTGIPGFDHAYGGIPMGRYIIVWGSQNSGKTTFVLNAMAAVQRTGRKVLYIPTEGVYDKLYAALNGVDIKNLLVLEEKYLGKATESVARLIREHKVDLVVFDSINMLLSEEVDAKKTWEDTMGVDAKRITIMLKKVTGDMQKHNIGVIIVGQVRAEISQGFSTGPSEVLRGGHALLHMPTYIIHTRKPSTALIRGTGAFMKENSLTGFAFRCEKSKSLLIREFTSDNTDIPVSFFNPRGLDKERTMFEYAIKMKVITQRGANYTFHDNITDEDITHLGENKFVDAMVADPSLFRKIYDQTWQARVEEVSAKTGIPKSIIDENINIIDPFAIGGTDTDTEVPEQGGEDAASDSESQDKED